MRKGQVGSGLLSAALAGTLEEGATSLLGFRLSRQHGASDGSCCIGAVGLRRAGEPHSTGCSAAPICCCAPERDRECRGH